MLIYLSLFSSETPLFYPSQYGFRKSKSCILQLLIYLEKIYNSINCDKNNDIIYTDFEKAFNNVDHGILLLKLYQFGVRGKIFSLIKFYLTGREKIRINGFFSTSTPVTSGVPQRSILSSLLFVIYVNDLPGTCKASYSLLCADDAKFNSTRRSDATFDNTSTSSFQLNLSRVKRWSDYHKLPLKVGKCAHLSSTKSEKDFCFAGSRISKTPLQKGLSIMISSNLKWKTPIQMATSKALRVFFMLKRSSPVLSAPVKLNLCKN